MKGFRIIDPTKIKIDQRCFTKVNNKMVEVEIYNIYCVKNFGYVYKIRKLTSPYRPLELLRQLYDLFEKV